jgi:hypothetical protein
MPAKRRTTQKTDKNGPEEPDRVQMLAVYHVDLMAEVEGLLRSLTRTQAQIERLRSGDANESHGREAINLLSGNLKTFASKLDTLQTTMPQILRTAEQLVGDSELTKDHRSPTNLATYTPVAKLSGGGYFALRIGVFFEDSPSRSSAAFLALSRMCE